jgi:hypothetical protein
MECEEGVNAAADPAFLISLSTLYELVLNFQKLNMKNIIFQLSLDTYIVLNYIFFDSK